MIKLYLVGSFLKLVAAIDRELSMVAKLIVCFISVHMLSKRRLEQMIGGLI
jgi:hypothetical protein